MAGARNGASLDFAILLILYFCDRYCRRAVLFSFFACLVLIISFCRPPPNEMTTGPQRDWKIKRQSETLRGRSSRSLLSFLDVVFMSEAFKSMTFSPGIPVLTGRLMAGECSPSIRSVDSSWSFASFYILRIRPMGSCLLCTQQGQRPRSSFSVRFTIFLVPILLDTLWITISLLSSALLPSWLVHRWRPRVFFLFCRRSIRWDPVALCVLRITWWNKAGDLKEYLPPERSPKSSDYRLATRGETRQCPFLSFFLLRKEVVDDFDQKLATRRRTGGAGCLTSGEANPSVRK